MCIKLMFVCSCFSNKTLVRSTLCEYPFRIFFFFQILTLIALSTDFPVFLPSFAARFVSGKKMPTPLFVNL